MNLEEENSDEVVAAEEVNFEEGENSDEEVNLEEQDSDEDIEEYGCVIEDVSDDDSIEDVSEDSS